MLVPLGDEERRPEAFAWLVGAVVASNLGLFAALCWQGAEALDTAIATYGARPHLLMVCPRATWQTALSSMFVHVSWGHVLGNMLFLWIYGRTLEDHMGALRFILFYLLCGLAALAVHCLCLPRSVTPLVGASGAVAGIMGAFLRQFPRHRIRMMLWLVLPLARFRVPAWLCLGLWFALQARALHTSDGMADGIAVAAHVGGFVTGLGLISTFAPPPSAGGLRHATSRGSKPT